MGCVVVVDAAAPLSLLKLQPLLVPSSFSSRFPLNPPPFFTGKGKGKGKGGTCLSCSHGLSLGLQGQQIRSLQRRYNRFVARNGSLMTNPTAPKNGVYTVGDFMTGKEDLHVVYPKTTVDEALEKLVEHRITGFPVVDQDWKLVGVVSDYDLLALDSISGRGERAETSLFPEVDRTWKTFNEIQRLLCKTNGKFVSDVMTPAPLVVRETTNLEDAARLLLETKYRRLPVVDSAGKLIGLITRGNVVRAALQIKRGNKHI